MVESCLKGIIWSLGPSFVHAYSVLAGSKVKSTAWCLEGISILAVIVVSVYPKLL